MQKIQIKNIIRTIDKVVSRRFPVQISVKSIDWRILNARFNSTCDGKILLDVSEINKFRANSFHAAETIELIFKYNHFKHQAQAKIIGIETIENSDGEYVDMLAITYPLHMQKIQRRNYSRTQVPETFNAQANCILGADTAIGDDSQIAIYSGKVFDISAGGFQMDLPLAAVEKINSNEIIRVQLFLDKYEPPIFVNAQYRHCKQSRRCQHQATVGFQFIGLMHTQAGREAFRQISAKLADFEKINSRVDSLQSKKTA